jgi:hypothetical protein
VFVTTFEMDIFISSTFGSQIAVSSTCERLDDQKPDDQNHQNFIRLLEVAISLNVPILPLTWELAFETLGPDGATGRVNQAPFNSKFSLAFKRFNPEVTNPNLSMEEFRNVQYNAMIAEMVVLSCPEIRNHPNIITLIGVCFEVSPVPDEILPVLVFAKASLGDLTKLVSQCDALEPDEMMAICGEVAKAIRVMHQCGEAADESFRKRS